MRKIAQYLSLCFFMAIGLLAAAKPACADYSLQELRIAATISVEIGSNMAAAPKVAKVMLVRYKDQQKYGATWADILYGNDAFQNSRGLASKSKDELIKYINNQSGKNNWDTVIKLAQQVKAGSLPTSDMEMSYQGKKYVINSFMVNYKGKRAETKKQADGRWYQTRRLSGDAAGHDYFYQYLGNVRKAKNYVYFDDNAPDTSHKYDNNHINKNINGATGNYSSSSSSGGGGGGGSSGSSASGGGGSSSSRPAAERKKPEGYDNREQCNMDNICKDYVSGNGLCWYCNVVVILTNAYLKSIRAALPSSIALGKLILKLGFLIWLAYYILQQVSSFAPLEIAKMLQQILVMGFKVALATVAVDAANSVVIDYFVNPIGGLGTDYGTAIYDRLAAADAGGPISCSSAGQNSGNDGTASLTGGEGASGVTPPADATGATGGQGGGGR